MTQVEIKLSVVKDIPLGGARGGRRAVLRLASRPQPGGAGHRDDGAGGTRHRDRGV